MSGIRLFVDLPEPVPAAGRPPTVRRTREWCDRYVRRSNRPKRPGVSAPGGPSGQGHLGVTYPSARGGWNSSTGKMLRTISPCTTPLVAR